MLGTVGNQGASIQQATTRMKSLNCSMTCSARHLDRNREPNAGGKTQLT